MFTVIFMYLCLSLGDSMADSVEPLFTHKAVDEGDNVTLSCKFETSATGNYLHWLYLFFYHTYCTHIILTPAMVNHGAAPDTPNPSPSQKVRSSDGSWGGTRNVERPVGGSEKQGEALGGGEREAKARRVGGSEDQGEASGGNEDQGKARGGSEKQERDKWGEQRTRRQGQRVRRDVHSRVEAPNDVHSRAAEPSDVHSRAAGPSDVHRRALAPSDGSGATMSVSLGSGTPQGAGGWEQATATPGRIWVTASAFLRHRLMGGLTMAVDPLSFVKHLEKDKQVGPRLLRRLWASGAMDNASDYGSEDFSGYAPQVGCELEEKERFWSELDEVMESIPTGERVVIGADFNGHVGEGNTGDEEVMGKFGVKERNFEGQMVVDFAKRMDMGVVNTYFQKREEHRVTYKSGGRSTQVDYILCRRGNLKEISDCKVVVGESVARQHRMVVCRMTLMVCKTKRSKIEIEKKTKRWKLKKEECCEEFRQKLRQALGGQVVLPDDWETRAEVIRETGRKMLGVSSGRRKEDKETWWWNEEVQDSVQRKRLAKKKWDMDRTEENRQEYKELQHRVKREVSKAKEKAYDELKRRREGLVQVS
ncbi:hypothetical protein QTP70_002439 [Hemibagrus guttatus]|uniref:Ig-like domain-containing protein n=1 Tax=Hemibagrus guttatus TaxID=175788 RepID=A0AAE0UHZ2_9TELE|nr:hypothetical protein QTP70_002439 [Hemibagrus guttatus]